MQCNAEMQKIRKRLSEIETWFFFCTFLIKAYTAVRSCYCQFWNKNLEQNFLQEILQIITVVNGLYVIQQNVGCRHKKTKNF